MENYYDGIDYLRSGNQRQKHSYGVIARSGLFESLAGYKPLLAGTIPIGIDIISSDLDIICHYCDDDDFKENLTLRFGTRPGFCLYKDEKHDAVICRFMAEDMVIEIFGTTKDPERSNAFRHMLIEKRILQIGGDDFKNKIIDLKKSGMKTEPAFAALLGLDGDPFESLLELENCDDEYLAYLCYETDK